MVRSPHISVVTPEKLNPSKPPLVDSWEAGADDRDTDKIFAWDFYCAAEERSLDRMHERHLRENAATRAVMNLKHRLLDDGIWIRPTAGELFLMASDWRTWAETEPDPEKAAKLNHHGDVCEALARSAHTREVLAKAKRPARKRRRGPKRSPR
jgi:hypothetical protein